MSTVVAGPCDTAIAAAAASRHNPHQRATLAATILGSSVAFIDGSVVNVALPAIARDLGADSAGLSWTINAYLLPLGALTLLGGAAGDHFGRRRLFLVGLVVFTLASVLCAAAPNLAWLLAARGFQGVGAALLLPSSLAILGSSFRGEARGRAIGIWAATGALAGALGPLVGGWLVDTTTWRAIFLLNIPVAAAACWLAWFYVPESRDTRPQTNLDWAGAATVTVALVLLTWSLTSASEEGASSTLNWITAVVGAAILAGFVWLEARRGDRAIMPLALFATPTFIGLTLLTLFLYAGLGGLFVLLPYFLIQVAGFSATGAGAALLPLPIIMGIGSPLTGKLTAKFGERLPLAFGAGLVGIGFLLYLRVDSGHIDYWSDVLPATLLVSLGMGIVVAPLTASVMSAVDPDHVGVAAGFNSAIARIGGLLATALLGFVFSTQGSPEAFASAFRLSAIIGAVLAALAAVSALLLIRKGR